MQQNKLAGRLFLCMIGVMLLLVGGVFEWLMIRSYLQAKDTRDWPRVEAIVLRSAIDERQIDGSPREFRFNVLFRYDYNGVVLNSESFSPRGSKWSREESSALKLLREYPVGSRHTAWVNPEREEQAILQHDSKAAGYTLWFPALIAIGGLGMIWGALYKGGCKGDKPVTQQ